MTGAEVYYRAIYFHLSYVRDEQLLLKVGWHFPKFRKGYFFLGGA